MSHIHLNLARTSYFLKWAFLSTRQHLAVSKPVRDIKCEEIHYLSCWITQFCYCECTHLKCPQTLPVINHEVYLLVNSLEWFVCFITGSLTCLPLASLWLLFERPLELASSQVGDQHFESKGRHSESKDLRLCDTLIVKQQLHCEILSWGEVHFSSFTQLFWQCLSVLAKAVGFCRSTNDIWKLQQRDFQLLSI